MNSRPTAHRLHLSARSLLLALAGGALSCVLNVRAAVVPTVDATPLTVAVVATQQITGAYYHTVATNTAALDSWLSYGTTALMTIDRPDDVACPIRLVRSGNLSPILDSTLSQLSSLSQNEILMRDLEPYRVKILTLISWCAQERPIDPSLYYGCAYPGRAKHIVINSNIVTPPITLAHELGHNHGLPHVQLDSRRIMYEFNSGSVQRLITSEECRAFMRVYE